MPADRKMTRAELESELESEPEPVVPEPVPLVVIHAELEPWLTKSEAAAYTRHSIAALDRAVHAGELRAGGTVGLRLFRRAWLDAWLGGVLVLLAVLAALCVLACVVDEVGDVIPCPCPTLPSATHRGDNERGERGREDERRSVATTS